MNYKREYFFVGTERDGSDDWVTAYIAQTGQRIECRTGFYNSNRWYEVQGKVFNTLAEAKSYIEGYENILNTLGGPELSFEISESVFSLEQIIAAVEAKYPKYKFNRSEARYESCVMAIFEKKEA